MVPAKCINSPARGGATVVCGQAKTQNDIVEKILINKSKVEYDRNVTVGVSAPGHPAGNWALRRRANKGVVAPAQSKRATDRWIGDIGERASIDARRGNFQHCAIKTLLQIVAMAEADRVVPERSEDRRRVEPVIQDAIRGRRENIVRRRVRGDR